MGRQPRTKDTSKSLVLLTINQASALPFSPSKPTLYNYSKQENKPGYLINQGKKWMIDINHPEWKKALKRNRNSDKNKDKKLKNDIKKYFNSNGNSEISSEINQGTGESEDIQKLYQESVRAKLKEPILKAKQLEYKIKLEDIKLKKQSGELIEYSLAEFLFFGYLEKANFELLALINKIKPIIINLCQENKPDEICKRIVREIEAILIDVKDTQLKDTIQWRLEQKNGS